MDGSARGGADWSGGATADLQRRLLPAGVPVVPGLQLSACYVQAEPGGGDWFDAVPVPDGRVALVVGDVAGTGVQAVLTMGALRTVVHEHLADGDPLPDVLAAADRAVRRSQHRTVATVAVTVVDPVAGGLQWCSAGHPPGVVVTADGDSRALVGGSALPLGHLRGCTANEDLLGPGDLVLMCTDGLLAGRGSRPDAGHERLRLVASRAAAEARSERRPPGRTLAAAVCEGTMTRALARRQVRDDAVALTAQLVPPVAALALDLEADARSLPRLRGAIATWAAAVGADTHDTARLQHVAGELLTNSAEHGTFGPAGRVRVRAGLDAAGVVTLVVSDDGAWRPPSAPDDPAASPGRGLGLVVAEELSDHLVLEPGPFGTVATSRLRLSTPAGRPGPSPERQSADEPADEPLGEPADEPPGEPADEARPATLQPLFLVMDMPGSRLPTVRVDGDVDAATAPLLRTELVRRCAGAAACVVDLGGVTHLASAGVAVLLQARAAAEEHGRDVVLRAPAGSPAAQVLAVAAVRYDTDG